MQNANREFRKVKSLYFLYEVNCDGTILRNVKSKKHILIKLDFHHNKSGYYMAFVCIKNKVHRVPIHRIVAECWLGDKPEGMEIDHIDRNSQNNHYTNLRYVTHSEDLKNRKFSDRLMNVILSNWEKQWVRNSKPVEIKHVETQTTIRFKSMTDCAKFLAEKYEKNTEQMRYKLKAKRKHIYDYDVTYLKAETIHNDSTE